MKLNFLPIISAGILHMYDLKKIAIVTIQLKDKYLRLFKNYIGVILSISRTLIICPSLS